MKTKQFFLSLSFLVLLIGCKEKLSIEDTSLESKSIDAYSLTQNPDTVPVPTRHIYGNDERQFFDLYLPSRVNTNTPIAILIHGGAWVIGPHKTDKGSIFIKALGWNLVRPLLDSNIACVIPQYRLACYQINENNITQKGYLDSMNVDIQKIVTYLKTKNLGVSQKKFAILGESAGGHLALRYALRRNSDTCVRAVVAFYAPSNLDDLDLKAKLNANNPLIVSPLFVSEALMNCRLNTNQFINFYKAYESAIGKKMNKGQQYPSVVDTFSPIKTIERNLPVLLMHGKKDNAVPSLQSEKLAAALRAKYNTTCDSTNLYCWHKLILYDNFGHGWTGTNDAQKKSIMNDAVRWIKQKL